jgi:hypothetical protein
LSRRDVARAVADRLAKFGGAPGGAADNARRKLEDAEEEVRIGTVALHDAVVTLLRRALSGASTGVDSDAVETIRARVEKLEQRVRSPSPRRPRSPSPRRRSPTPVDKGKGKEPAPPSESAGEEEAHADQRDPKRGRARALLEEVLARLEDVEGMAENAMQAYQQVADDISVLNMDFIEQGDVIEELSALVQKRKRKRRASDADESRATSAKATAEPEERPASQSRTGEADMEIDEDSEDGEVHEAERSEKPVPRIVLALPPIPPKPKPDASAPAAPDNSGLVDEMAQLREQMAAMEQRLNEMQAAAPAVAPATTEAADVDQPDKSDDKSADPAASAAATLRELSLPQNEAALSPAMTLDNFGKIRETLEDMSKHLASLQARVDAFAKVDVQTMLDTERAQVQTAVQNLLDSKWHDVVAATETAIIGKLDEHIARAVPAVVAREIRALAAKSPNLARTKGSQSAPPPGASPTPQSPTVPLQQRLSLPSDQSVRPPVGRR